MRHTILALLFVLVLAVVGCGGDLADMDGGSEAKFADQSQPFELEAGDEVDVSYAVGPLDDGMRSVITATLDSTSGLTSDEIVSTTVDESDAYTCKVKIPGEYVLTVFGRNAGYSITVSE